MPEGMELNAAEFAVVEPFFREMKVSQEQAQKMVSALAEFRKTEATKAAEAAKEAQAKQESDYQEWLKGETDRNVATVKQEWGAKFEENIGTARRAIARFASADVKKMLDETGLGSHPSFVKMFHTIGQMIREDVPPPNSSTAGKKTLEARLYPNMTARAN